MVSAPAEVMDQIAEIVRELDQNPAKKRKVFVYSLKNADPETVAAIVQGMFEESGSSSSTGTSSRTTQSTSSRSTNNSNSQNSGNTGNNSSSSSQQRF